MRMSGMELKRVTSGHWLGASADEIRGISTDSRTLDAGEAFLALVGPNFDGHDYQAQAIASGASALIGAKGHIAQWDSSAVPILEVNDTLEALGAIASAWRSSFGANVLAITGSYGKTTVRSLIEHVLSKLGWRVAVTKNNNNNLIGVPQTLLAASGEEDLVIVECGISESGEMARLASITKPDIAVLTGLALSHTEQLEDISGVACEKSRLLHAAGKWCALGAGVANQLDVLGLMPDVPSFSMDSPDAVSWRLDNDLMHLTKGDAHAVCKLALPACHWAANMALTADVVCRLDDSLSLTEIAGALDGWHPPSGRFHPMNGPNGSHIYDDAYNANPASMAAALNTLRRLPGRRMAILGDMLELGAFSAQAHAELNLSEIDRLILVGPNMRQLARNHHDAVLVTDANQALQLVSGWELGAGDHLLIKASRGMRLDIIVRALTEGSDAL